MDEGPGRLPGWTLALPVAGAVLAAALAFGLPPDPGLDAARLTLPVLTLSMVTLTLGTGRTTALRGAIHPTIAAAFTMVTVLPQAAACPRGRRRPARRRAGGGEGFSL